VLLSVLKRRKGLLCFATAGQWRSDENKEPKPNGDLQLRKPATWYQRHSLLINGQKSTNQ
jgi:hypothetical protein